MASPSFMQFALEEARAAAMRGEVPVGCVIVRDGEVVARAGNHTIADRDPTAHAELLAIRQAAVAGSELVTPANRPDVYSCLGRAYAAAGQPRYRNLPARVICSRPSTVTVLWTWVHVNELSQGGSAL